MAKPKIEVDVVLDKASVAKAKQQVKDEVSATDLRTAALARENAALKEQINLLREQRLGPPRLSETRAQGRVRARGIRNDEYNKPEFQDYYREQERLASILERNIELTRTLQNEQRRQFRQALRATEQVAAAQELLSATQGPQVAGVSARRVAKIRGQVKRGDLSLEQANAILDAEGLANANLQAQRQALRDAERNQRQVRRQSEQLQRQAQQHSLQAAEQVASARQLPRAAQAVQVFGPGISVRRLAKIQRQVDRGRLTFEQANAILLAEAEANATVEAHRQALRDAEHAQQQARRDAQQNQRRSQRASDQVTAAQYLSLASQAAQIGNLGTRRLARLQAQVDRGDLTFEQANAIASAESQVTQPRAVKQPRVVLTDADRVTKRLGISYEELGVRARRAGKTIEEFVRIKSGATTAEARNERQLKTLNAETNKTTATTTRATGALGSMGRTLRTLFTAFVGFQALRGIQHAGQELIQYQSLLQQVRLGVAEVLLIGNEFRDRITGAVLPIGEQLRLSFGLATRAARELVEQSIRFGLPLDTLVSAFQTVGGIAQSSKVGFQDTLDIVTQIGVVAQRLNIPFNQLTRSIDNIFTGLRVQQTQLGVILQLNQNIVQEQIQQGTLGQFLLERLRGVAATLPENLKTFEGIRHSLRSIILDLLQRVTGGGFDLLQESLRGLRDRLNDLRNSPETIARFREAFSATTKSILETTQAIAQFIEKNRELLKVAAFAFVGGRLAGGPGAVAGGLVGAGSISGTTGLLLGAGIPYAASGAAKAAAYAKTLPSVASGVRTAVEAGGGAAHVLRGVVGAVGLGTTGAVVSLVTALGAAVLGIKLFTDALTRARGNLPGVPGGDAFGRIPAPTPTPGVPIPYSSYPTAVVTPSTTQARILQPGVVGPVPFATPPPPGVIPPLPPEASSEAIRAGQQAADVLQQRFSRQRLQYLTGGRATEADIAQYQSDRISSAAQVQAVEEAIADAEQRGSRRIATRLRTIVDTLDQELSQVEPVSIGEAFLREAKARFETQKEASQLTRQQMELTQAERVLAERRLEGQRQVLEADRRRLEEVERGLRLDLAAGIADRQLKFAQTVGRQRAGLEARATEIQSRLGTVDAAISVAQQTGDSNLAQQFTDRRIALERELLEIKQQIQETEIEESKEALQTARDKLAQEQEIVKTVLPERIRLEQQILQLQREQAQIRARAAADELVLARTLVGEYNNQLEILEKQRQETIRHEGNKADLKGFDARKVELQTERDRAKVDAIRAEAAQKTANIDAEIAKRESQLAGQRGKNDAREAGIRVQELATDTENALQGVTAEEAKRVALQEEANAQRLREIGLIQQAAQEQGALTGSVKNTVAELLRMEDSVGNIFKSFTNQLARNNSERIANALVSGVQGVHKGGSPADALKNLFQSVINIQGGPNANTFTVRGKSRRGGGGAADIRGLVESAGGTYDDFGSTFSAGGSDGVQDFTLSIQDLTNTIQDLINRIQGLPSGSQGLLGAPGDGVELPGGLLNRIGIGSTNNGFGILSGHLTAARGLPRGGRGGTTNQSAADIKGIFDSAQGIYDLFGGGSGSSGGGFLGKIGGLLKGSGGTTGTGGLLGKLGGLFKGGSGAAAGSSSSGGFLSGLLGSGGGGGGGLGGLLGIGGGGGAAAASGAAGIGSFGAGAQAASSAGFGGIMGAGHGIGGAFGLSGAGGAAITSSSAGVGASAGAAGGAAGAAGAAVPYAAIVLALVGAITGAGDAIRKTRRDPNADSEQIKRQAGAGALSGIFNIFGLGAIGGPLGKLHAKLPSEAGLALQFGPFAPLFTEDVFGLFRPKTPGTIISAALSPLFREAGFPRDVRISPVSYGIPNIGNANIPGNLAGLRGDAEGAGALALASTFFKLTRKDVKRQLPQTTAAAILGTAGALGIAEEDTRAFINRFSQTSAGDFNTAGFRITARYRKGGLSRSQATGAFGALIAGFEELPPIIDQATIALLAFDEKGTVSLKRLQRAAEDAKAVIGEGVPNALLEAVQSNNPADAALSLAEQFSDTFTNRVAERLTENAVLGKSLTEAVRYAEQAAEALVAGNLDEFNQYSTQARESFISGRQTMMDLFGRIFGPLVGFNNSLGVFSSGRGLINATGANLLSFDTETSKTVPGAPGQPLLSITHGQERVYNGEYHDDLVAAVHELARAQREVGATLLRRGGNHTTVELHMGPEVIAAVQRDNERRDGAGQGFKVSTTDIGVAG